MDQRKDQPIVPEKLYFKIGEVAKIAGVKPYVLRYWETEFPDIIPAKTKTQQRLYNRKEVECILKIKDLLYQKKFTIKGARSRLKEELKEEKVQLKAQQITLFEDGLPKDKELLTRLKEELEGLLKVLTEQK